MARERQTQPETPNAPRLVGPSWPKGSMALGCALPYYEGKDYVVAGRWWSIPRATRLEAWWHSPLLAYVVRDILEINHERRTTRALSWIQARDRADALSDSVGMIDRSAARGLLAHGVGRQAPTEAQMGEAEALAGRWGEAAARMAFNLGMAQVGPSEAPTVMASVRNLLRLDRDGLLPRCLAAPPDLEPPAGYRERPTLADRFENATAIAEEMSR